MSTVYKPLLLNETGEDIAEKLSRLELMMDEGCEGWSGIASAVRAGRGPELFPVGSVLTHAKVTSWDAQAVGSGVTGATLAHPHRFVRAAGAEDGEHFLHYDGATWYFRGKPVSLQEMGLEVTGTPAKGSGILVTLRGERVRWRVLDHDYDTSSCNSNAHTMTIGLMDSPAATPLDYAEALYYAENGLAAGTYSFTLYHGAADGSDSEDGTYAFTLTKAVPAGGCLWHTTVGKVRTTYGRSSVTAGKIASYTADGALLEQVACTVGTGTSIGTASMDAAACTENMNTVDRVGSGCNRYSDSDLRLFLHSAGSAAVCYRRRSKFDMPFQAASEEGFMSRTDTGFAGALCPVRKRTALYGGGYEETDDKVFVLSMGEIGLGQNGGIWETSCGADGVLRERPYAWYGEDGESRRTGDTAKLLRSPVTDGRIREYALPRGSSALTTALARTTAYSPMLAAVIG